MYMTTLRLQVQAQGPKVDGLVGTQPAACEVEPLALDGDGLLETGQQVRAVIRVAASRVQGGRAGGLRGPTTKSSDMPGTGGGCRCQQLPVPALCTAAFMQLCVLKQEKQLTSTHLPHFSGHVPNAAVTRKCCARRAHTSGLTLTCTKCWTRAPPCRRACARCR